MKEKVLSWTQQFNTFCFLDNHQYNIGPHSQECLVALGVKRKLDITGPGSLNQLEDFIAQQRGRWLFGHLGYDLKNEIEIFDYSLRPDPIGFSDLCFFEPQIVIRLNEAEMIIEAENPRQVFEEIEAFASIASPIQNDGPAINIQQKLSEAEYVSIIEKLRDHILRGDCYEINFCQEFFAENVQADPVEIYRRLSKISPNPFSALYRNHDKWLICASPERFLKKEGAKVLSQPIKGTSKRIPGDKIMDEQSRQSLFHSSKDRSENVMVVDLVRNDLAKVCEEGTVKVEELYGVYSFPQVHQMISTVTGELKEDISFKEIIMATFPMGSMTGAPKKKVMELIDRYEVSKRGIFSGAIGYVSPSGDFDFNVVIRSILYNSSNQYLSFLTGSGITFYSEPRLEWEECLLKAEAIHTILTR